MSDWLPAGPDRGYVNIRPPPRNRAVQFVADCSTCRRIAQAPKQRGHSAIERFLRQHLSQYARSRYVGITVELNIDAIRTCLLDMGDRGLL